jgi:transposase-like protein
VKHIETWRNRSIDGAYSYVYLDGIVLKRSWAGEIKNVSVLLAAGVDKKDNRRILGRR